ncbi:hypothetical protein AOLI_G00274030 [Acnodon oligacanthus]
MNMHEAPRSSETQMFPFRAQTVRKRSWDGGSARSSEELRIRSASPAWPADPGLSTDLEQKAAPGGFTVVVGAPAVTVSLARWAHTVQTGLSSLRLIKAAVDEVHAAVQWIPTNRPVMWSCSSAHCVLIFLAITVSTDVPTVRVGLHDSATLPCSERCSGLVRWTVFSKPSDPLAECDQTSCRSMKEGYQMIHDQYLKGNLSLIITDADFTKRDTYTCDCDYLDICDVTLQVEFLKTSVQIESGDSLVLDLDLSDPVEVIYNSAAAAGPPIGPICTVHRRSLQCKPEYTQRASLTSGFELRRMTPSDSGVYTIWDTKYKEIIHVYTVTVQDKRQQLDRDLWSVVPLWKEILGKFALSAGLAGVIVAKILLIKNMLCSCG